MISRIPGVVFCGIAWALGPEAHGEGEAAEDTADSVEFELREQPVLIRDEKRLRTAIVNIQEVFRSYHKVARAEAEINLERGRIQREQNQEAARLQAFDQVLRELDYSLQELDHSDPRRLDLEREKGIRFHERERWKLQRAVDLKARHADLNRRMAARMKVLLEEIHDLVREEAELMGFDLVFDVEGTGTSQVPFLLFARDSHDITPRIIRKLAESAPQDSKR